MEQVTRGWWRIALVTLLVVAVLPLAADTRRLWLQAMLTRDSLLATE
jgi:hypothetical protein